MPGFIIHIGQEHFAFSPEKRKKLKIDSIAGNGYSVERRVVNKFMNDRLFFEDELYLVIVEGVVLNTHELMQQYASDSWKQCIIRMYQTKGEPFFNSFRGSFSGALFDKKKDKWLIYTGQTGEKQVFYSQTPGGHLFGSEMRFMVDCLKYNHIPVTIDETGAYMSLTHGFCFEDRTLVKEVHKLTAGHYLRLSSDGLEIIRYHRFSNKPDNSKGNDRVRPGSRVTKWTLTEVHVKIAKSLVECHGTSCIPGAKPNENTGIVSEGTA